MVGVPMRLKDAAYRPEVSGVRLVMVRVKMKGVFEEGLLAQGLLKE